MGVPHALRLFAEGVGRACFCLIFRDFIAVAAWFVCIFLYVGPLSVAVSVFPLFPIVVEELVVVGVKFSRRAAVAGSLAAATLATAGTAGAVSGALADGAGDDGVSGDPGRVGGVDPTDEDALAEATGEDASVLDSTRSVVVPAPSFGSFMTSDGERVPVEPTSGSGAGGVVAVELDSSGADSSQLGAAEDHAPGSSVDDGSHGGVAAPDAVPDGGANAEIPSPPADTTPADAHAAPSEGAHAEVPAAPSDTTPSEGATGEVPAPPSDTTPADVPAAPSEDVPGEAPVAPPTDAHAAPSEGAHDVAPAAPSDTARSEIPAPPSADTHAAPSEGSQADVPSAHAGSDHAATGDVAPPAHAGAASTGNAKAPVAPSGGVSGSQATVAGGGGSEARTGASDTSTGDAAPGDQGAPGKVTEPNGGNIGVTAGASDGRATGGNDGAPSLSVSDAAARLADAQRDYDAAKAAYDAAVNSRADVASARAALADAERAVSDAEARVSAAERAVSDAEADASRAGTVDWRLSDEGNQARVVERLLVQKVNAYRADAGLPALVASRTLDGEAQSWSAHMAGERDFNHDPSMSARLRAGVDGAQLSGVGENIAYAIRGDAATGKTPEQIADSLFAQWKDSPAHNHNMLGAYTVTGVGVSYEGGRVYATQKFAAVNSSHRNVSETDVSRFYTVGDAASALHVDAAAFGRTPASGGSGDVSSAAAFGWANRVGATVADGTASGLSVPGVSGDTTGRVEEARSELASARSGLEAARGVASDARARVAADESADVDGALRALSDAEAALGVARSDAQAAGVAGVTSVSAGVPSPA